MSDKSVGIIGQKYEDRKTGKCGILESRDDKYKTLLFRADDGSTFSISNSSFRSNWRKVKEENTEPVAEEPVESIQENVEQTEEEVESVEESVEQTEEVEAKEEEVASDEEDEPKDEVASKRKRKHEKKTPQSTRKNYDGVTNENAILNFISAVGDTRKVEVKDKEYCLEIIVDGMIVTRISNKDDDTFNIAMLPDIFTLSDWKGVLNLSTIEYKANAENYLGVIVDTYKTCIPEILDIIQDTTEDINLYGYLEEDCEDENDGEN